ILSRPAAAIVGSRDQTPYGASAAHLLASGVARAAIVVSGMARGLDAIAHAAALDAGGTTGGVLGNGLGGVCPAANRALYQMGAPSRGRAPRSAPAPAGYSAATASAPDSRASQWSSKPRSIRGR